MHAASLVHAARERLPGVEFCGLTGPRLRELGVETVFDFASHAAMLSGVFGLIDQALKAIKAVEQSWRERRPDLVVLLDSPELHLRLARKAKKLGLPVLYYIAPQTWASRAYRNRQIPRCVDRLACILPFEEEYFRRAVHGGIEGSRDQGIKGFDVNYVGHPLFETLRNEKPIAEVVEFLKTRAAGRPIVALLPGSRRHVIDTMLPKQLEVVRRLRGAGRDVYAAISCVSQERRAQIREILAQRTMRPVYPQGGAYRACASSHIETGRTCDQPDSPARPTAQPFAGASGSDVPPPTSVGTESGRHVATADVEPGGGASDAGIDIVLADNASLLSAADLVLVASGTATLEVAYYRKPMIVMYDAGRLLSLPHRLLGRFVLRTPHLSLVNILAGARVVPEFMPFVRDSCAVATVAGQLLTDATWRNVMIRQLDEVIRPLEASEASANVCRMMAEMLSVSP